MTASLTFLPSFESRLSAGLVCPLKSFYLYYSIASKNSTNFFLKMVNYPCEYCRKSCRTKNDTDCKCLQCTKVFLTAFALRASCDTSHFGANVSYAIFLFHYSFRFIILHFSGSIYKDQCRFCRQREYLYTFCGLKFKWRKQMANRSIFF